MPRYLGVDLAWGEGSASKVAKETGLVCVDESGKVLDAGWARGIDAVVQWLGDTARPGDVIAVDAPLVVFNETGMRECERQVAQRYGRWQVYANPSNLGRPWMGGVTLRKRLETLGFVYSSGDGAGPDVVTFFECYPYTTLVGAFEFGYDIERPRYKRFNNALANVVAKRAFRASECDELLRRMATMPSATPPLDLASHPVTSELIAESSPLSDIPYKHREDLLDAALCAWTAALWHQFGEERCQVLGLDELPDPDGRVPVIIAPARPEQRAEFPRKPSRARSSSSPTATDLVREATRLLSGATNLAGDVTEFAYARLGLLAALDDLETRAIAPSRVEVNARELDS